MSDHTSPVRVAIVNDYEIVVKGLEQMLRPFGDRVSVVELDAGGTPSSQVDIALFDTFGGRRRALGRIEEMVRDRCVARVVLYTWDAPEDFIADVMRSGIDGVILKRTGSAELVDALERIHRGDEVYERTTTVDDSAASLTEREREVLALIARGLTNREIASELYLSLDTIKTHARKLFQKMGVSNRTQAALRADEYQLSA